MAQQSNFGSANKNWNHVILIQSSNFVKKRKMIIEFLSGLFVILIGIKFYLSKFCSF